MGIFKYGSSSSYDKKSGSTVIERVVEKLVEKKLPNPDPYNWILNMSLEGDGYLLVDITYPDCKNYEGRKIMLYENVTVEQLEKQKTIDPHFSSNKRFYSPIARFEPTKRGWDMGKKFIDMLVGVS